MPIDFATIKCDNIRRYGEDIGRIGPMLLAQRYDNRSHFIFELLQNAEDALRRRTGDRISNSVRFDLTQQSLNFSHFGQPFSEQDVQFICGIGESTEAHRVTDIGRFGIGFKSVYAFTDAPEIHSGDEHFAIDSFVWPRETLPHALDDGQTLFHLRFRANDDLAHGEVLAGLSKLNLSTLLFLREIEEIAWSSGDQDSGTYLRESQVIGPGLRKITLIGESQGNPTEESQYLVLDRPVFHQHQSAGRVEIAFRLQAGRVIPVENATLSVFFPTIVPTRFGAILQGPFQTTPSRDNIPRDNKWNQYLVREMAGLLTDSLGTLRDRGILDVDALNALPVHKQRFPANELFHPLYATFVNALRDNDLIRCVDGSHHSAGKVRIGRTKEIRDLFSPDQLGALLGQREPVYWISDDVSRDKTPDLRKYLMEELSIQEVDPDFITRQVTADFLSVQPLDWLVRFYEFLNGQESAWRKTGFLEKPFIRLSEGSHVAPFRSTHPLAYLPSTIQTSFPTVHPDFCRSKAALEFLRKIGLTEPDPVDDVIHNLLPRYRDSSFSPSESEYTADLARIHAAFTTDSTAKKTRLIEKLRETPFVFATDQGTGETIRARPQRLYLPTERLKGLFAGITGVLLADITRGGQRYDPQRELLRACGASEYLVPLVVETTFSTEELRNMRRKAGWENNTGTNSITDQAVRGLDALLKMLPELSSVDAAYRARLLWEALSDLEDQRKSGIFSGKYSWFYFTSRSCTFDAAFVRKLNRCAWVPKPDGMLGLPSEVVFEDFQPPWKENAFLLTKIPFKPSAVVELAQTIGLEPAALDLMKTHGITEAKLRELLGIAHDTTDQPPEPKITPGDAIDQLLGGVGEPTPPVAGGSSEYAPGVGNGGDGAGSGGGSTPRGAQGNSGGGHSLGTGYLRAPASGAAKPGFHTYVRLSTNDEPDDPEGLNRDERLDVEKKAIAFILMKEPSLHPTPPNNPGFDLYEGESLETATRFVEVKSRKGPWSGPVTLSSTQFEKAQSEGERFWLYVVEKVGQPEETTLHPIQSPAGKAHHFCYDPGWKSLAEPFQKTSEIINP